MSPRLAFQQLTQPFTAAQLIALSVGFFALLNPLGGALSSACFPFYRQMSRKDRAGWATRVPAFVHAVGMAYLSYAALFEERLWTNPWHGSCESMKSTILVSLGYMLYDTLNEVRCVLTCPKYKATADMMTHHVVTAVCMLAYLNQVNTRGWEWSFSSLTSLMLGTEITTPLLNLLWMLRKAGLGEHWSAKATGLAIMVGFVIFRVGVQAWQSYTVLLQPDAPVRALWDDAYQKQHGIPRDTLQAAIAISTILLVLNSYWLTLMVRKALDLFGFTKGVSANSKSLKDHDY